MKPDWQKIIVFLCAILPGGGYMYHGMMKKGAMLMALFTALLGAALTVGWKFLAFLLPVIWCYCFFDTFHVMRLSVQQREEEDALCFRRVLDFLREDPLKGLEDKRTVVGVLILLAALYTVIYGVLLPFFRWSERFAIVRMILSVIPTAVVAVLLFFVGKHILQKGQENDADDSDEPFPETEEIAEETDTETAEEDVVSEEVVSEEIAEETDAETAEGDVVSEEIAAGEAKPSRFFPGRKRKKK